MVKIFVRKFLHNRRTSHRVLSKSRIPAFTAPDPVVATFPEEHSSAFAALSVYRKDAPPVEAAEGEPQNAEKMVLVQILKN